MKEELEFIGKRIIANKRKLAELTVEYQEKGYDQKLKDTNIPTDQILEWRMEFFEMLGEALFSDLEVTLEKTKKWAHDRGNIAIQQGVPLNQTIKNVFIYRDIIWDSFSEELNENKFSAITMLDVSKKMNPIIDEVCYIYSQIFVEHSKKLIESTYNTLQQLSVPVVPLAKDVAVVPLIGEIDTYRSRLIMETTLEQSTRLDLDYLIMDVSGVPIVDTVVAHNLFRVVNALKLVGVESIITGIRPEIAQTVVSLGIGFKGIKTLATLDKALVEIGFTREDSSLIINDSEIENGKA